MKVHNANKLKGSSDRIDPRLKKLYLHYGILEKWHNVSFDDFKNDGDAKELALKYIGNWRTAVKDGIGLFMYGLNGVGKTHLMMCILKKLVSANLEVRTITLGDLIKLYTNGWYRNSETDNDETFNDVIKKPRFLEIEEIGKEYKVGENDLGRTVLDTTVRYRLQSHKPILFTTNLAPKEIGSVYTHDIASMLYECTVPIQVKGVDWRKEHKFNNNIDKIGF